MVRTKFINATNTIVCQHQRSSFNAVLPGILVSLNGGCKTCSGRGFSRRVHSSRGEKPVHVLQELRFSCRWIPNNANVDISTQPDPISSGLMNTPKKQKQNSLFDFPVTKSSGCNGIHQLKRRKVLLGGVATIKAGHCGKRMQLAHLLQ